MSGVRDPGAGPTWDELAQLPGLAGVLDPADSTGVKNAFIDCLQRAALGCVDRRPGQRILDFGCGTGRLTDWLREHGADVLGVDASDEMIAEARTRIPSGRFEVLESDRIPAGDNTFDTVLSVGVLQYFVTDPSQLETVSRELARVLVGSGQLVLIEQVHYGGLERGGTLASYRSGLEAGGFEVTCSAVRVSPSRFFDAAVRHRSIATLPGLTRVLRLEASRVRPEALVGGRYADYLFVGRL